MIYATCGHDVTDYFGRSGAWYHEYTREGEDALAYGSVCDACRPHYDLATREEVERLGVVIQPWEVKP